jgi:DNA-binding GntR family transcriptional regulator
MSMATLPTSRTTQSSKRSLDAANDELFPRIRTEESFKSKVYTALKEAIIKMDVYSAPTPVMLDERELSDRLGVSRTPIREAVAMLEQDGFLRTVPRRGILVVRKTKREVIEMVQAWAALESMAVRLITLNPAADVASLRQIFKEFSAAYTPSEHLNEYSSANIAFHQAIIRMSGSQVLRDMTDNLLLHVRGIRQITIGKEDRAQRSIEDHLAIITAIENRDTELAERLSRDHTLGLAAFIEEHGNELFE